MIGNRISRGGEKTDGDILIHCGDFSTKLQQRDFEAAVEDFDRFLGSLGHRHKVN